MAKKKSKKAQSSKKKNSKKKASSSSLRSNSVESLNWSVPGHARATVFFTSPRSSVYLVMFPALAADLSVETMIGDSDTVDDVLDLEHFDTALVGAKQSDKKIHALLINKSPDVISIELAFMFAGGERSKGQKYQITIEANEWYSTSIPVELEGA